MLGVRDTSPTVSLRFSFLFPRGANVAEVETALPQEALWTNGSATRRGKKLVLVWRSTLSPIFFFLDAVPKAEPIAMEMLDIEHAALEVDGIFSAPLLAFPVSAPLAEMFQSQTVTSAHFQL